MADFTSKPLLPVEPIHAVLAKTSSIAEGCHAGPEDLPSTVEAVRASPAETPATVEGCFAGAENFSSTLECGPAALAKTSSSGEGGHAGPAKLPSTVDGVLVSPAGTSSTVEGLSAEPENFSSAVEYFFPSVAKSFSSWARKFVSASKIADFVSSSGSQLKRTLAPGGVLEAQTFIQAVSARDLFDPEFWSKDSSI